MKNFIVCKKNTVNEDDNAGGGEINQFLTPPVGHMNIPFPAFEKQIKKQQTQKNGGNKKNNNFKGQQRSFMQEYSPETIFIIANKCNSLSVQQEGEFGLVGKD